MHPILDHQLISERYFFPQKIPLPHATRVKTSDGIELACWRSAPPSDKPVLVHFHGNGELVHHWIPDFVPTIQAMGYEVFLAEYRGYGASGGAPRLGAMLHDVQAIVEAVGLPTEKLVAFGRSVGSIYAIEMAYQFPDIAGLILESGICDVLQRLLLRMHPNELGCTREQLESAVNDALDHEKKLKSFTAPLLVLHAEHDDLVPIIHAETNHRWSASRSKKLVRFPRGDHNSILAMNTQAYFFEVSNFLGTLNDDSPESESKLMETIEKLEVIRTQRTQGLDKGRFVRRVVEEMDEQLNALKDELAKLRARNIE